jgi:ABC-type Fe3+-siderophore transport system permease subunit
MLDLQSLGKVLLVIGTAVLITGGLLLLVGKISFLGSLPGDIRIQRGNWGCYIPLATSIILSLILTVLLNIIARLFK